MFDKLKSLIVGYKIYKILSGTASDVKKEAGKMEGKKWWQSKTILWNIFTGVSTALVAVLDSKLIADPKIIGGIALANTIVNVILRSITDQPITK